MFRFAILPKAELQEPQEDNAYQVKNIVSIKDVNSKLYDAKIGLDSDGPDFILENFDTYFSLLVHGYKLELHILNRGFEHLIKAFRQFYQMLKALLVDEENEFESEQLLKLSNVLQMLLYLLSGFLGLFDQAPTVNTTEDMVGKKRGGAKKKRDDRSSWTEEKCSVLVMIYNCIQLPIRNLFEPPVPEPELITLLANTCYKALEDPAVKTVQDLRHTIFQTLGTLVKEYGHGSECSTHLIKLIQTKENSISAITEGVCTLVNEFGCKSLINRLVMEIADLQVSDALKLSAQELKTSSTFLIELTRLIPDKMMPEIAFLAGELNNENPNFRITILTIITEVLVVLSGEGLSEEAKDRRDFLLERLQDYFYDGSSVVRSKVLGLWGRLQQDQAIPVQRQLPILELVVERLRDKVSNVRKTAIATLKVFLEFNPFASTLNVEQIEKRLEAERKKFEELTVQVESCGPSLEKMAQWLKIHLELKEFIKQKVQKEAEDLDPSLPSTQTEISLKEAVAQISTLLFEKQFEEAYAIVRLAEKQNVEAQQQRKEFDEEFQIEYILSLFHKLFIDGDKLIHPSNITPEQQVELKEQHEKQEQIVEFFESSYKFAELCTKGGEVIKTLVRSKTVGESQEAVDYICAAKNFSVSGNMHSILEMLSLMYLPEQDRKEYVVKAFRSMFLSSQAKSNRGHAVQLVKNLLKMMQTIKKLHYLAFKDIVKSWVAENFITNEMSQILWEYFTLKHPETTEADSRAALLVLVIISEQKPEIVTANLNVLETVITTRGTEDLRIVGTIASMIAKLSKTSFAASGKKGPFKYAPDDKIVTLFIDFLKETWSYNDPTYLTTSLEIVNFFYAVCDFPDKICTDLILCFYKNLYNSKKGNKVPVYALVQFVTILGHVGLNQLVFLDITIYKELKRRNLMRDEASQKKSKQSLRKSRVNDLSKMDDSSASMESASLSRKKKAVDEEQFAVEGAVADDADAEYIFNIIENQMITESTLLGRLLPLLINILNKASNKPNPQEERVITATTAAFLKILSISQTYTELHIPLVFTILDKCHSISVKKVIIFAVADLTKRFPNLLEPWTPLMYKRLRDKSMTIRKSTIMLLSNLIQHDLVRVKGQISEMALCIIDPETAIENEAKSFFKKLAQKGHTLYNVMPDIISKLSDPSAELEESKFQTILKYILNLIQKDKQMESLVAKLYLRLRVSVTPRQWSDLAYCLSIINYNDKALKYLIDNVPQIKEKLLDCRVYNYFKALVAQTKKSLKPDIKALGVQLMEKIDNCIEMGNDNEEIETPERVENKSLVNESQKIETQKPKTATKKTKKQRRIRQINDSSDEENDSEIQNVQLSVRKSSRRNNKK